MAEVIIASKHVFTAVSTVKHLCLVGQKSLQDYNAFWVIINRKIYIITVATIININRFSLSKLNIEAAEEIKTWRGGTSVSSNCPLCSDSPPHQWIVSHDATGSGKSLNKASRCYRSQVSRKMTPIRRMEKLKRRFNIVILTTLALDKNLSQQRLRPIYKI